MAVCFLECFLLKCRKIGGLPLKNDDFLLQEPPNVPSESVSFQQIAQMGFEANMGMSIMQSLSRELINDFNM